MSRRKEIAVGLLVLGSALLAGWMAVRVGAGGLGDEVEVEVRLADATGLTPGAPVLVAGVQVGRVAALALDHDAAIAELALDPEAGLRRDVLARVRARSLLGEKFVELVPAGREAPLLQDGDRIERTAPSAGVEEVLAAAAGLLGAVDPEVVGPALDALARALAEDPERPARLLAEAEALLEHLDALAQRGEAAADTLARRGEGAADGLDAALADVRALLAGLDALLARTGPPLAAAAEEAAPAVEEARALVAELREALRPLGEDPRRLERILHNLAELDRWELRRLLREEGILIRVRKHEVVVPEEDPPGP